MTGIWPFGGDLSVSVRGWSEKQAATALSLRMLPLTQNPVRLHVNFPPVLQHQRAALDTDRIGCFCLLKRQTLSGASTAQLSGRS